ncbi:hypothetical protein [Paenarthrobacter nitroguajacolicus]
MRPRASAADETLAVVRPVATNGEVASDGGAWWLAEAFKGH